MNGQYIVLSGEVHTGLTMVGPFPDEDRAYAWANANLKTWRLAPLDSPSAWDDEWEEVEA
jgi:hypothetical protein